MLRTEFVARLLSLGVALAVWVGLFNRLINLGAHGPVKLTAMALSLLLALAAGVLWPMLSSPWSYAAPVLLVALLGLGEVHRIRVRARSHARDLVGTPSGPERLFSTTALVVRHATVQASGVGRLRVVHLSDLHVGPHLPFEYFRSALARSMAENPDLILITGDFVSRQSHLPLLRRLLVGSLHARYGVYAVLGNHDYWTDPGGVRAVLEEAGIRRVAGTRVEIDLGSRRTIVLQGTEQPWGPGFDGSRTATCDTTLVLSHTPDNVYRSAELGAKAVFSGHTHGGQFRVPRLGGVIVPSMYGRRFDRGHFRLGNTHLFVSAGIGTDSVPLRVFCPPDFLVVDFVDAEETPVSGTRA